MREPRPIPKRNYEIKIVNQTKRSLKLFKSNVNLPPACDHVLTLSESSAPHQTVISTRLTFTHPKVRHKREWSTFLL